VLVRVVLAAILAGAIAGALSTAAQSYRVIPLILEAEQYEDGEAKPHHHGAGTTAHGPDTPAWSPGDGAERLFYTFVANLLAGTAFALLLTAGILFSGRSISPRSGLVWGACGFTVFVLAPNFGLPPELPGMAAGDLVARQFWWAATAATTAAGLWLFAFKRGLGWMALGVCLILSMHVVGAPVSETHSGNVPAKLAAEFAIATVVTSALFWLALGLLLGTTLERALRAESASRAA
jgi:cobalt transporter subunit CbtA